MIPKSEILFKGRAQHLPISTVEKDYVISWVLAGIFQHSLFANSWIFKGGTCIKKCYFGNYRFSEDLDFTVIEPKSLSHPFLEKAFSEIGEWIYESCGIQIKKVGFEFYRNLSGGTSFQGRLNYIGPLKPHVNFPKLKLDLTAEERIVSPPEKRTILHNYSDPLPSIQATCYPFDELFAEKLRALGQRARPRDLYDVIHLHQSQLNQKPNVAKILKEKCAYKNIPTPNMKQLEAHENLKQLKQNWENMLKHQLPKLDPFEKYWSLLPDVFAALERGEL